jgi:hypothetical protein
MILLQLSGLTVPIFARLSGLCEALERLRRSRVKGSSDYQFPIAILIVRFGNAYFF